MHGINRKYIHASSNNSSAISFFSFEEIGSILTIVVVAVRWGADKITNRATNAISAAIANACLSVDNEDNVKPRKVRAKITRSVTEVVICLLDRDGNVEEIDEIMEELDYDVTDVHSIQSVLSVHP